jgi:GH141 insertion domain/Right handed beta helix region
MRTPFQLRTKVVKNMMSLLLCALTFVSVCPAAEFHVAPDGVDTNPGTADKPQATVAAALRKAWDLRRLKNPAAEDGVLITVHGGTYSLSSPLFVRPEDSGTESSPTIIAAAPGEHPVFSGGVSVAGWKKAPGKIPGLPSVARGKVWVADAPKFSGRTVEIRQLWVNDLKAVRAREPNGETLHRLLVWDRVKQEAWIPADALGAVRDPAGLEMVMHQQWEIAICRVKSLRLENQKACVTFQQPESKLEFEHPWPQPVMSTNGNAPFYLVNAIEFLNEPGEWFQDLAGGRIYYWPRPGEDLTKVSVIVPALETLMEVEGSLDHPVAHVQFKGIEFTHTTWRRPAEAGHVPLQAGMFLLDAYKLSPKGTDYHSPGLDNQAWIGRPPGAVFVKNAEHVRFERCRFEHLASAGLDFASGTRDDVIEGCVFRDIGGNGIQLGKFSDPGFETHRPYRPADEREICTRERVANNLVTDCANEDWGCVGILVGYGRGIAIEHNEVSNVSYTGISMGWGWNKATNCMNDNRIFANHVHHVATRLCDTAGIYTLSPQPGTVISENFIHDIHMSPYVFNPKHWFYLYLDEGSSFITVRDNWCPEEKFMKNANGPGNVWENNGPMVPSKIKEAAGLEPAFQYLLTDSPKR